MITEKERDRLQRQISMRQTYRCPVCGEFEAPQEGYSEYAPCPKCGTVSKRPRLSSRDKSIIMYAFRDIGEYLKHRIKAPLEKAIILFANRLDFEPSHENCKYHNTHILLNKKDKFFSVYFNRSKEKLMQAVWKLLIFIAESDRHYRLILYRLVQELTIEVLKGNWKLIEKSDIGSEYKFWNIPLEDDSELRGMLNKIKGLI